MTAAPKPEQPASKPGVHRDLPYDQYASIPALRATTLIDVLKAPAYAKYRMANPEETTALRTGNATHSAILEADTFEARYAVAPHFDLRRTADKAAKLDWEAQNADKLQISAKEYEQACYLRDSVYRHPLARAILAAKGLREVTLVAQAEHGLEKARPDMLIDFDGVPTMVDLKTCADASPEGFARSIAQFGYAVQSAFHLRVADAVAPIPRRYLYLCVEKVAPYLVSVLALDDAFRAAGERGMKKALQLYVEAERTGIWRGYGSEIQLCVAPPWAARAHSETEWNEVPF